MNKTPYDDIIVLLQKFGIFGLENIPKLVEQSKSEGWNFPEAEKYLENFYDRMKFCIFMEFYDDRKTETNKT